jgi:hypothetical protein
MLQFEIARLTAFLQTDSERLTCCARSWARVLVMKTNKVSICVKQVLVAGVLSAATILTAKDQPTADYVVHEWGTFTSVQVGDGQSRSWRPLRDSDLPTFVYDWDRPGLGRRPESYLRGPKFQLLTLQRMETPVIYFYSQHPRKVDVEVGFPRGLITEWFPQASQIGPASLDTSKQTIGSMGASLGDPSAVIAESAASWRALEIMSTTDDKETSKAFPADSSRSHYYQARHTRSNPVRAQANPGTAETEKFIFYRGVGNFEAPLTVMLDVNNTVTISNAAAGALQNVFVLNLRNDEGEFVSAGTVPPNKSQTVQIDALTHGQSTDKLVRALSREMEASLIGQGLYPEEASAMVNTWKDSWFEETGIRVLFLLPQSWTQEILPLRLEPKPKQLVRVMIGRVEVLPRPMANQLAVDLTRAAQGDRAAEKSAARALKDLGRFAEPAFDLAMEHSPVEIRSQAAKLLVAAQK